jgi:hypothetical protein
MLGVLLHLAASKKNRLPGSEQRMELNTYESAASPQTFVTIPTMAASSTLRLVEDLVALRLSVIKHGYSFPDAACESPFARSVLTQIVDRGYALHGQDRSFAGALLPK